MYPTFFHSDGIFMVCFVSSPKRNPPPHSAASNESYTSISLSPLVGINSLIYYLFFVHTPTKVNSAVFKEEAFYTLRLYYILELFSGSNLLFYGHMRQKSDTSILHHTLLG